MNQGRVVSKAQILDHVWHYDFGGDGGVVETYIGYLRRKLDTVEPRLIHTIRGVGYTLRAPAVGGPMSLRARLLLGVALIALVLGGRGGRHRPHHRGQPGRPGRRPAPQRRRALRRGLRPGRPRRPPDDRPGRRRPLSSLYVGLVVGRRRARPRCAPRTSAATTLRCPTIDAERRRGALRDGRHVHRRQRRDPDVDYRIRAQRERLAAA